MLNYLYEIILTILGQWESLAESSRLKICHRRVNAPVQVRSDPSIMVKGIIKGSVGDFRGLDPSESISAKIDKYTNVDFDIIETQDGIRLEVKHGR